MHGHLNVKFVNLITQAHFNSLHYLLHLQISLCNIITTKCSCIGIRVSIIVAVVELGNIQYFHNEKHFCVVLLCYLRSHLIPSIDQVA